MRTQRTSQVITAVLIALSLVAIACALWSRYYRGVQDALKIAARTPRDLVGPTLLS